MRKIRVKNIPIVVKTKESSMSLLIGFDFKLQEVYVIFRSNPKKIFVYKLPRWANIHAKKVIEKRTSNLKDVRQLKRLTNYVSNFIVHMGFDNEARTYV